MTALFTSAFTDHSSADEVLEGVDLSGRRSVVTGAGTGIGSAVARSLARRGAEVTLAVRMADREAAESVARQIRDTPGSGPASVEILDLVDRDSIAHFADRWDGALDILVNNAGVMNTPEMRTAEGWELQFATNYLGHADLAQRLHPALRVAGRARIVSVSSSAHRHSPVIFEDPFFTRRPYDPDLAYAQSKSAINLFAVEADRRWSADGIRVNAVMPGGLWTDIQRHLDPEYLDARKAAARSAGAFVKNLEQGAAPIVLCAASPLTADVGGRYIEEDCQEAHVVSEQTSRRGVLAYSVDPENARRLWELTDELLSRA